MTFRFPVRILCAIFVCAVTSAAAFPFPQQQVERPAAPNMAREVMVQPRVASATPASAQVRTPTPEMTARYNALRGKLTPSAAQWVAQQSAIEAKRATPDRAALDAAIRARFGA